MRLLSGNDLATGDVLWWAGAGWSRHLADAVAVGDELDGLAAREEAARRVNMPYPVEAVAGAAGPVPTHIKDRVRGYGPSVRPDLAIDPAHAPHPADAPRR